MQVFYSPKGHLQLLFNNYNYLQALSLYSGFNTALNHFVQPKRIRLCHGISDVENVFVCSKYNNLEEKAY